jgi:ABC-type Fe3+-hydroxamate transport system substrate-binding protein
MRVKQAVKHFALLSIVAVAVSACSSTEAIEEQVTQTPVAEAPMIVEPLMEEPVIEEKKNISAVITNGVIEIPVLKDAQVFAEFSDKLPAVINYFTHSTEAQVINFYQQAFGKADSQERKRNRLTLQYQKGEEMMRVVISQQNKKRQVDIIIENKN